MERFHPYAFYIIFVFVEEFEKQLSILLKK